MKFNGIGASPGIAIGKALVIETTEAAIYRIPVLDTEIDHEIRRFDQATATARDQLLSIREKIKEQIGKRYGFIFDAHLLMLDDKTFVREVIRFIREEKVNAEWALKTVVGNLLKAFENIDDPYFKERGGDIEDVYKRIQAILSGSKNHHKLTELNEDVIVVAHSLSPSDTAMLNTDHVVAFATDAGGRTSHTAILANALEIPAVVGLIEVYKNVSNHDEIIVDGNDGTIILKPDEQEKKEYRKKKREYEREDKLLLKFKGVPAITKDGIEIKLMANIELPAEIKSAIEHGAQGIGLYRSEFLFLLKSPDLPTEEDHYQIYKEIAEKIYPEEVLIRTLDLGGEKYFHAVLEKDELNPVMGLRAIRLCLKRQDIFKKQLRGILRASEHGNVKVMFPLVSTIEELRNAKRIMEEVKEELKQEKIKVNERIHVGIMIEVPAAAMMADILMKEVQFVSIGTNDLIQYYMAADRSNKSVSYLYQPLHPSILRILKFIIESAEKHRVDVSLCGEMASDPLYVPVLLGLGLRKLSMNPKSVPKVKDIIKNVQVAEMEQFLKETQEIGSAEDIEKRLRKRRA